MLLQDRAGARLAEQERGLRERLCLQSARRERRRADQPGPRRLPRRGVEQVVGVAAVLVLPHAHVQPRGRDAPARDLHGADDLTGQRMLDLHVVGLQLRTDAADREVPAAVDDEAGVTGEAVRDGIRAQTLARAAGVDPQARAGA